MSTAVGTVADLQLHKDTLYSCKLRFSYSGHAFGKQRRHLAAEQLCALVVGFSFKGEVTDVEIRDHMKSRSRSRREAAEE